MSPFQKTHIVSATRIGEIWRENCQFLEIRIQEMAIFSPEIASSWVKNIFFNLFKLKFWSPFLGGEKYIFSISW